MPSVYHLLARQIPAHIQQQYPVYCKFIEYYYRWLQTYGFVSLYDVRNIDSTTTAITVIDSTTEIQNYLHHTISNGTAVGEVIGIDQDRLIIRYLTADATFTIGDNIHIRANSRDEYTDEQYNNLDTGIIGNVETLPSAFIEHFSRLLDADQIFGVNTPNIATILRNIRQLYQSKGNEQALIYLIKALKGIDVEIRYPWERVLKFSDGRWNRQYCITVAADYRYWHYVPLNMKTIRLMLETTDSDGNQQYRDIPIARIEVFAKQHENYDQNAAIANQTLTPFSYDIPNYGFDNGYWMPIVNIETLTPFVLDEDQNGYDVGYWLGDGEYEQQLIRFTYDDKDKGYDIGYWLNDGEYVQDIFDYEINAFDKNGPYWIRDEHPELGPYETDPITGAIIFEGDKAQCTYGRWGYRYVTPFVRFYFDERYEATLDQEVRVIETNENGDQYVSWVGNVVVGVDGVQVTKPGKGWQVGQIFTASGDDIWYIYTEPQTDDNHRAVTLINEDLIEIEYSINKPLIGRVLTLTDDGGIDTVEILQYGDHIPQHGGKPIVISPLFYNDPDIDPSEYQAEIVLKYAVNSRGVGYFEDPRGFLSYSDICIQDSDYWQQFSYDIVANVDGNQYQHIAQLLHPVGTKMFTTYMIENNLDAAAEFEIEQTYPFTSISLFEVAYATEKLFKLFVKNIKEFVDVGDFCKKTLTKLISGEQVFVTDGHYDNTLMYSLELNYDSGREDYKWVERTVDTNTHKKTSYVDSGFNKLVHINYDYHSIEDFPQNPPPQISLGGHVNTTYCDGLTFTKFVDDQQFYEQGTTIEYQWTIEDPSLYSVSQVTCYDSNGDSISVSFNRLANNQYSASFTMPNGDVVVGIVGQAARHFITVDHPDHGTIRTNKSVAYTNETVTITATPINRYWTIDRYFYTGDTLGTVYLNDNTFVMPNEDVVVSGQFIQNGGFVKVDNPLGGTVNFNVDLNQFVEQGTPVKFTVVDNGAVTFANANIVYQDGAIAVVQNQQFTMPRADVTLQLNFRPVYHTVNFNIEYDGVEAEDIGVQMNITPSNYQYAVGSSVQYMLLPRHRRIVIEDVAIVQNGTTTTGVGTTGTIVVGSTDVVIQATAKQTGGLVKNELSTLLSQYVSSSVQFRTWVRTGDRVTLTFADRPGYTFKQAKIFWEKVSFDNADDPQYSDYVQTITSKTATIAMKPYNLVIYELEYQPN